MKLTSFFIFFVVCIGSIVAQTPTWEQKREVINLVDDIFQTYKDNCKLTEVNQKIISENVVFSFTKIFSPNAIIFDDITPMGLITGKSGDMTLSDKTINQYLENIRKYFPSGLQTKITNYKIDYSQISKRLVNLTFEHSVTAVSVNKIEFSNKDTLLMEIQFSKDFNNPLIQNITKITSNLIAKNDLNHNWIPDEEDMEKPLPELGQVITPPAVKYVKPLNLIFIKIQNGIVSFSPGDLKKDYYSNAYDSLLTIGYSVPGIKMKSGYAFGLSADFKRYFGKQNQFGFGAGLQLWVNSFQTEMDTFSVQYRAIAIDPVSNDTSFYRRMIHSTDTLSEKISVTQLLIPVMASYKLQLNKKLDCFFDAGLALSLLNSFKSTGGGSFDYEGRLSLVGKNYSFASKDSTSDWVLTQEAITNASRGDNIKKEENIKDLNASGFDIGFNKSVSSTREKIKFSSKLNFVLNASARYKINDSWGILAGFGLYAGGAGNKEKDYQKITGGSKEYHSFFHGLDKYSRVSFSLNLGITYKLK